MRSKLLLTLASIATLLAGCSKENVENFTTSKATTDFNVSVDDGVKTRAEAKVPTRYVMEIYKGATAIGTPELHQEQATGTFSGMALDAQQQYTVLFWADYGTPSTDGKHPAANEYNACDLKAAVIAKQPTATAYAGVSQFTVGVTDESVYTNVTLNHAVAQVNFKQTEALATASNTLTVKYPKSYSLNVDGNAVTEVAGEVTHTFIYNNKAIGTLGTSYIIAATGTPKTLMDITATLNSETAKTVTNVPFERNYRTNISGAYSDKYDATLSVTCEDAWETPDNEGTITPPHVYDDNTKAVVPEGEGTEAAPYLLASAGNIKWLKELKSADSKDKYFKLMTDIEVTSDTWTPIGYGQEEYYFNGCFDGNDHKLTGKLTTQNRDSNFGVFATVGQSATVKNLINEAEVYAPEYTCVGGIVGECYGVVINCKNTGKITGHYYVGGIVGSSSYLYSEMTTGTKAVISACENGGEITALSVSPGGSVMTLGAAGGIVGGIYFEPSSATGCTAICQVENCKNTGNVSSNNTVGEYVGGILGRSDICYGTCKVKGCTNSGTIKVGNTLATQDMGSTQPMLGLLVGGQKQGTTVIED
jgi:hypothetical protein